MSGLRNELLDEQSFPCPYCGEEITIPVDRSGGERQQFVTDCEVCCHPIVVKLEIDKDGEISLEAEKEN